MDFLNIRKEKSAVDLFADRLMNVEIRDKGKIEKNYNTRLSELLVKLSKLLNDYPSVDFLVIFNKKEAKKSWYSMNSGKVVINSNFDLSGPEFNEDFQKAVQEFETIESGIKELNGDR